MLEKICVQKCHRCSYVTIFRENQPVSEKSIHVYMEIVISARITLMEIKNREVHVAVLDSMVASLLDANDGIFT